MFYLSLTLQNCRHTSISNYSSENTGSFFYQKLVVETPFPASDDGTTEKTHIIH